MNVQISYKTVEMLLKLLDGVDWDCEYIESQYPKSLEHEYNRLYKIHNLFHYEHYVSVEIDVETYFVIVELYKNLEAG